MLLKPQGEIKAHHDQDANPGRRTIAAAINLAFYQPEACYLRRVDTKEELPFENCTAKTSIFNQLLLMYFYFE